MIFFSSQDGAKSRKIVEKTEKEDFLTQLRTRHNHSLPGSLYDPFMEWLLLKSIVRLNENVALSIFYDTILESSRVIW